MDEVIIDGNQSHGELLKLAETLSVAEVAWKSSLGKFLLAWLDDGPLISAQTSGSTGKPKTIELEKARMHRSARMTLEAFDLKPTDSALLPLSADYIAGKMMIVRALVGRLILHAIEPSSDFWTERSWPNEVEFAPVVPMQVYSALEMHNSGDVLSRIGKLLVGGAPLDPGKEIMLAKLHDNTYHSYGMTETMSHVALRKVSAEAQSARYRALPGVFFDSDDRDCLVVMAPKIVEKPLQTNDRVKLLSNEEFILLGRADNVINTGGIKVQPEEVERTLSHVVNRRFLVAGLPDAELGQRVALILEGNEPEPQEKEAIKRYSAQNLKKYAQPRAILCVSHFEETSTGKIDRASTISSAKRTG